MDRWVKAKDAKDSSKKDRAAWIEAAFSGWMKHGPEVLIIDQLAAGLGVTKGSFYWHFRSREELLLDVLGQWEQRFTDDIIVSVESIPDPSRWLKALLEVALGRTPANPDSLALLGAPAFAAQVRTLVAGVHAKRLGFLRKCFSKLGFSASESSRRATLLYALYRGLESVESIEGAAPVDAKLRKRIMQILKYLERPEK